ncbi:MAG: hypothetical protein OEY03_05990 [Rhizobacter sp.]|nr:hypothetical protein [Rhizobacter sp.]
MQQFIRLHPAAPPKPALGQACTGCGVCCLAEPCPLGQLLSGRRHGACTALRWDDRQQRYQCGAVVDPLEIWSWLPVVAGPWARRLARRWISAAKGCDSDAQLLD